MRKLLLFFSSAIIPVLVCMPWYAITQNVPLSTRSTSNSAPTPPVRTHLLMGGLTGFKLFYGADCVSTTTTQATARESGRGTRVRGGEEAAK